ncbi:MAG: hypothetical protein H3C43_11205 [Leptonema sp. (in: Bacteria)]|nr:hypothetical protein [Leptonema sp. (in: bacteria)]
MAITKEQRQSFNQISTPYNHQIESLTKEQSILNSIIKQDSELEPYVRISQAVFSLQKATLYLKVDTLSQKIQNLRTDTNINNARKEVSNALADLIKMTGAVADMTLTENQEVLEKFTELSYKRRLNLVEGFRQVLDITKEAEGTGKYRWYFAELYSNLSLLCFVFMDFKLYERTKNPDQDGYSESRAHLDLLIDTADTAAREYRQKYEMAGKDVGDLQRAIKLLEMLKVVYSFAGNPEEQSKNELNLTSMKTTVETLLKKQKQDKK